MSDTIAKICHSQIQHGPANNRIYLMKLAASDVPGIIPTLDALALQNGYTKIFAKIPVPYAAAFEEEGYLREGTIPAFYSGQTAAAFLGKFIALTRRISAQRDAIERILALTQEYEGLTNPALPRGYSIRPAVEADADDLAAIYGEVFASYPFPIHDKDYLIETMRNNVCYFVVEKRGRIVAAASGEMDIANRNAEMTDFATLPPDRGNGLAVHLLTGLEAEMRRRNIATLYTIARAVSPGMNITFAKCGYTFGGTLINNTQIAGRIESMNLWYKRGE